MPPATMPVLPPIPPASSVRVAENVDGAAVAVDCCGSTNAFAAAIAIEAIAAVTIGLDRQDRSTRQRIETGPTWIMRLTAVADPGNSRHADPAIALGRQVERDRRY